MNEVKKPKRPLIFYYCIFLVVILFINLWSRRTTSYRRGMEA